MNLFCKLTALFRKEKLDAEMSEEMRVHLEFQAAENEKRGMTADEARYAALREFGGIEQIKERARDQRGFVWLEHLAQDVRYAARQLRKAPGFTAVAVLSLALGIGANSFFFGLLDRALVRSLPVKNPEELIRFQFMTDPNFGSVKDGFYDTSWSTDPGTGKLVGSIFSLPTFEQFRTRTDLFSDVLAFAPTNRLVLKIDRRSETAFGQFVSGEYYRGLGIAARHGRVLLPDDDRPGAAPVAVISERCWQRVFAGDPAVLGRTIWINRVSVTIVGVVAGNGEDPIEAGYLRREITLPLAAMPQIELELAPRLSAPSAWWLSVMARLRPGVTAKQAVAALEGAFQQTARVGLNRPGDPLALRAVPGARGLLEFRRQNAQALWLPASFAAVVLLAACINVATLLLARGAARRREIALRLALGATRRRIVSQLVTESLLLALLGAAAGLLIAMWGGLGWTHADAWHLDRRVLGFTALAALSTAIGFGLLPALRATRLDLTAEFQGGTGNSRREGRSWLGRSLVIGQMALSCVLLVIATLLVRTTRNLRSVDLGFDPSHLLFVSMEATYAGLKGSQATETFERIKKKVAALPGVRAATFSSSGQLNGYGVRGFLRRSEIPPGLDNLVRASEVAPDYLATHGIPLVAGRDFTSADDITAHRVAIIDERAAKLYFGTTNPIGRTTALQDRPVIIGVARDAKRGDLRSNMPNVYLPFAQNPQPRATLTIRAARDPALLATSVRKIIAEVNADLLVDGTWTTEQQLDGLLYRERSFARLAIGFGALALTLACVGLYGFLSFGVARRTREIGVRVALGAMTRQVVAMIVRESVGLAVAGLGVGLLAAAGTIRFVTKLLYGLPPWDPVSHGLVALLLLAVAGLAAWVPARRAAKVDPMVALRAE
jgi:predicted permease